MVTLTSDSPERTQEIAAEFATKLRGGDCIALDGELGAGKTQLVRGLVGALGGDVSQVSSPTFVLLNIYSTPRLTIYHLDAYRVGGADDLEAIGFSELLDQGGIVIVEWAERVRALLPDHCIRIQIDVIGEHSREIHFHV
jgi:tRNA threonylcarbamoyladenosine biosynthesis protein TsaE